MENYWFFADFSIVTKIFSISTQSSKIDFVWFSDKYSVAPNNFIQYFVSDASFRAMFIFDTKSGLLCAYWDSVTLAPILVPARSNCLDRMYSFFSSHKNLYNRTILIANWKLLFSITLSIIFVYIKIAIIAENRKLKIFHFPFSIFNFCKTYR